MAKNPVKPAKTDKDRHKDNSMVRLTPKAKRVLTAITAQTRRAKTTEVEIALDSHAKTLGIKPPDTST